MFIQMTNGAYVEVVGSGDEWWIQMTLAEGAGLVRMVLPPNGIKVSYGSWEVDIIEEDQLVVTLLNDDAGGRRCWWVSIRGNRVGIRV